MTGPDPEQAAVYAAYQAASGRLRQALLHWVGTRWAALSSWRDPDADQFVSEVAPVVGAAQQSMSALTSSWLTQHITAATGQPPGVTMPDLGEVSGAGARNGADPEVVYRRPFTAGVWTDLSKGRPLDAAVESAGHRLTDLAATDLQLAKTRTAQRVTASAPGRIVGYRRELGPTEHHCALCLLTSARVYHKRDLQPMHPNCDCDPVPVERGEQIAAPDPEAVHQAITATLGGKYADAAGRGRVNYRDIVVTYQHGELGPVLGVRGQHHDGPGDIPALTHQRIGD